MMRHAPANDSIVEILLGVFTEEQLQAVIEAVPGYQSRPLDQSEYAAWLEYASEDRHDEFPDLGAVAEVVAIYAEAGGFTVGDTRFTKAMKINFVKGAIPAGKCAAMRCKEAADGERSIDGRTLPLCARHIKACQQSGQIPPEAGAVIVETTAEASVPTEEIAAETEAAKNDLAQIADFKIETQDDMEMAAAILGEAKGRYKKLEARLQEITKPMREAEKSVRDLFRPALQALAEIERLVKSQISTFELDKERRNQAALAAAAAAAQAGDVTASADALAKVVHVENAKGVSTRPVWRFKVTDEAQVPRPFLSVDERKIRDYIATWNGEKPEACPGLEWVEDVIVIARAGT